MDDDVLCSNIHVLAKTLTSADANCGPLSVFRAFGMPNLAKFLFELLDDGSERHCVEASKFDVVMVIITDD